MYLHVHVSVVYNQHYGLKKTNYYEMYLTVLNMYSAQEIINYDCYYYHYDYYLFRYDHEDNKKVEIVVLKEVRKFWKREVA